MCGISAVTGKDNIVPILYQSILNLEYRGYDSCGLGVVDAAAIEAAAKASTGNGTVTKGSATKGSATKGSLDNGTGVSVRKNVGGVEEVNQREHLTGMKGNAGIAHTRWATHGKVSRENSHPHSSMDGRFSIVHNGIINNYQEIREELRAKGVIFLSETDTEVLVHLISQHFEECGDVEQSFLEGIKRLEGSYAFCMVTTHQPDAVYCVRQGSPLVLGFSPEQNFVASDVNAFLQHTRDAMFIEDGEYAVVTPAGAVLRKVATGAEVKRKPLKVEWDAETSRKGGYAHYMLKEIFEQPQTLVNALNIPGEDISRFADSIASAGTTYLIGVGTTYYVALTGQYFFSRYAGRYLPVISSDEFEGLAVIGEGDLLISISQSGETYDTRRGVAHAKANGARTASIVNVMGSSLSTMTDQVIMQGSGPEICVVSTKAALAQMVILLRIAMELGLREKRIDRNTYDECFKALETFPSIVQDALNERSGSIRNLAERTGHYRNWLVLGRGVYFPIALEAALKLKEITYLHVEGMPGGFLKHGTLSLVDENMLSFFLIPPPEEKELHQHTLTALEEVKARGGPVVGFTFAGDTKARDLLDHCIEMPKVSPFVAPFLHMIMSQLYAYFTALKLNRSIDKPRNLAKSVTVG